MRACSIGLAAAAMLSLGAVASPTSAATILFSDTTATWSAPTGASVTYAGNGTDHAQASWGASLAKSSYLFSAPAPVNVLIGDAGDYGPFTLGTFTHYNSKINGGSITAIKLSVSTTLIIDGVDQGARTFEYALDHWETPNNAPGHNGLCANGMREHDEINLNGCADRVRAKFLNQSELVKIGGKLYALDISGLIHDGNPLEEFWTKEKGASSADLRAQLRLVSAAVPEPANWAMMIVGFGVAGSVVRLGRRRHILQV